MTRPIVLPSAFLTSMISGIYISSVSEVVNTNETGVPTTNDGASLKNFLSRATTIDSPVTGDVILNVPNSLPAAETFTLPCLDISVVTFSV